MAVLSEWKPWYLALGLLKYEQNSRHFTWRYILLMHFHLVLFILIFVSYYFSWRESVSSPKQFSLYKDSGLRWTVIWYLSFKKRTSCMGKGLWLSSLSHPFCIREFGCLDQRLLDYIEWRMLYAVYKWNVVHLNILFLTFILKICGPQIWLYC